MIHIYLFGPHNFVEGLIALSDMQAYVTPVGVSLTESDPILYQTLLTALRDDPESFVILTPRFGDRFSTIALSMPRSHVYVISGVNVEMLCGISQVSQTIRSKIARVSHALASSAPSPSESTDSPNSAQNATTRTSDETLEEAREDVIELVSRSGGLETAHPDGQTQELKTHKSRDLLPPPLSLDVSDSSQDNSLSASESSLNAEWSVVTLCELLSARAQDGVSFLNSLLRAEDDESNIDLSMLETEYGLMSADQRS